MHHVYKYKQFEEKIGKLHDFILKCIEEGILNNEAEDKTLQIIQAVAPADFFILTTQKYASA